jgi:hypothetical protein
MNQSFAIDIESLTTDEKLDLIELLWRDLSRQPDKITTPEWHLKVLEEAERGIADGMDHFIDLDEFEADLKEKISRQKTR